jgi:hypothetical protein
MGIGPVEYMIVAFPGNKFNGEIAPALADLVDSGTIRVLDLAIVVKDQDGNIVGGELEDADSDIVQAFRKIVGAGADGDLLNEEDIQRAGEALEPNSSAAVLVWEDLWATRFAEAVRASGGVLVEIQRIPYEFVQAALDYAAEPATA